MVDKRLEEIRTSDMAESAVNVELIEWLKTYGLNIALVFLLIVAGTRGYFWLSERRDAKQSELWERYASADQVISLRELAREAEGIGSLPEMALLQAAEIQLQDLIRNESAIKNPSMSDPGLDGDGEGEGDGRSSDDGDAETEPEAPQGPSPMTAEERAELIDRMYGLFEDVAVSTEGAEDFRRAIHIKALFGLAACEEMRGSFEDAIDYYDEIESMVAGDLQLSAWAAVAINRRDTIDTVRIPLPLPTQEERRKVMAPPPAPPPLLERPVGDADPATAGGADQPATGDAGEGADSDTEAGEEAGDEGDGNADAESSEDPKTDDDSDGP